MVIRFLEDTNIRKSIDNLLLPPIGIVFRNTEIEVENRLFHGAPINEINTYFRDNRGWYYWSGKSVILYKALPSPRKTSPTPPPEEAPGELIGPPWESEEPSPPAPNEKATPLPPEATNESPEAPPKPLKTEADSPETPGSEMKPPPVAPEEEAGSSEAVSAASEKLKPEEEPKPSLHPAVSVPDLPEEPATGVSPDASVKKEESPPEYTFEAPETNSVHWGLKALKIPSLFWQENKLTGKGVRIALLDTGIDDQNPGLADNIREQIDFCSDPPEVRAVDLDGHGTACAEILCSRGGPEGPIGAAPEVDLFVGKIMNHFFDLNFERLIEGIHWALQLPVDIIFTGLELKPSSLSDNQFERLRQLTEMALQQDVLLVASAGDSKLHRPDNRYPAGLEDVLSIGAHDPNHQRHPLSIKSLQLDVLVPGGELLPESSVKKLGLSNHITGFSAALATGALALVNQYLKDHDLIVSGEDLLHLIRSTATARIPGNTARDVEYGFGFLNTERLLAEIKRQADAVATGQPL